MFSVLSLFISFFAFQSCLPLKFLPFPLLPFFFFFFFFRSCSVVLLCVVSCMVLCFMFFFPFLFQSSPFPYSCLLVCSSPLFKFVFELSLPVYPCRLNVFLVLSLVSSPLPFSSLVYNLLIVSSLDCSSFFPPVFSSILCLVSNLLIISTLVFYFSLIFALNFSYFPARLLVS